MKWETLGDSGGGVLLLQGSRWRKIEAKYTEEAEHKKEGVKHWIWYCPYASWRWLITHLDWEGKHAVAYQIRGYAEKLSGTLGSSLY